MLANVQKLSEAGAVLNICFESPAYKKLNNTDALKMHELLMRIDGLVESIAAHYNDNVLQVTHQMARVKMSGDPSLREYAKATYQYCSPSLLTDMDRYLEENEKVIQGYLKKKKKQ